MPRGKQKVAIECGYTLSNAILCYFWFTDRLIPKTKTICKILIYKWFFDGQVEPMSFKLNQMTSLIENEDFLSKIQGMLDIVEEMMKSANERKSE